MDIIKHLDVFNPSVLNNKRVAVVGLGALGSHVAYNLAKLGVNNLILFDRDRVESHNLPNQLYGPSDVGKFKADALSYLLADLTGNQHIVVKDASGIPDYLVYLSQLNLYEVGYVFVCVDSMAQREKIFNKCIYLNPNLSYFCEARMGASSGQISAFAPTKFAKCAAYKDRLYPDSDVVPDVGACGTVLSIGATAQMLAAYMTWHFIATMAGKPPYEELMLDMRSANIVSKCFL